MSHQNIWTAAPDQCQSQTYLSMTIMSAILQAFFKCVFVNAYYCILIENDTAFCTQGPNLQFVSIDSGNDLALLENDPLPEPNWPTLITPDGITNLQCVRWLLANDAYTSFKMIIIMCNPVTCLTHRPKWITFMMTSPNGNNFRVTGPLCGEFTGPRWIPPTKASDAELWCFFDLRLNKRLSKQSIGWLFETLSRPLLRHCNVTSR